MSEKDEEVQKHLTEAFFIYFHWFAHKLKLVLEQSVETVLSVKEIFAKIINYYISNSEEPHEPVQATVPC